ncbi:MAG: NADP oxidoreductase, partial [Maribacter sp.]|nr:NADP oxidoreductase [Maribacter sp.]
MNNLVNLTIDGKSIQAEAGKNLVDVAKAHGVYIPTLCYFR